MADRHAELQDLLDRLVASARARRIREAWAEAAERLGLAHHAEPRLFDDVIDGTFAGLSVRVTHLALVELMALSSVVSVDALGALPSELVLEAEDLIGAYDWARAAERPPSSTAYRSADAEARAIDARMRSLLLGEGGGIGAALRQGSVTYHHAGPVDDGELLIAIVHALTELVRALVASPDAIPDQLLTQAQTATSASVRERCAEMLRRCYPTRPHSSSLPP